VIFGAGNKLRADGPYLALLREFDAALEETDVLLVVGYSFRDDHVNTMLTSWMNTKEEKRMVILDNAADDLESSRTRWTSPWETTCRGCQTSGPIVSDS